MDPRSECGMHVQRRRRAKRQNPACGLLGDALLQHLLVQAVALHNYLSGFICPVRLRLLIQFVQAVLPVFVVLQAQMRTLCWGSLCVPLAKFLIEK